MTDNGDQRETRAARRWSWRRKVLALASSMLLSLLVAELGLRVVGYRPLYVNPEQSMFWEYHPRLGWHHRPGQVGRFSKLQFDTAVEINQRGLRDHDYTLERKAGRRRLLVLGDSFTWGFGVEQPEIFTEVVESLFDDVDVINAGVSGYSPDQELTWLSEEGYRYQPDLVLLVLSGNDVWGNHQRVISFVYGKPVYQLEPDGSLTLTNVPAPTPRFSVRLRHQLRQRSSLAQLLISGLERWRYRSQSQPGQTESAGVTAQSQGGQGAPFPLTMALIKEIDQVSRKHGARLAIVTNSIYWAPWPDGDYHDFVNQLQQAGYPLLDIDGLPGYDKSRLQIPGDRHWNAAGHKLVGNAIHDWLVKQQLLP